MAELVAQGPFRGGFLDVFDNGDFVVHTGDPSQPETQSTYYQRGHGPRAIRAPVDRFLAQRAQTTHAEGRAQEPAVTRPQLEDMYVVSDPRAVAPSSRLTDLRMSAVSAMERAIARESELRQPVPLPGTSGGEETIEERERRSAGEGPPLTIAGVQARRDELSRMLRQGTLSAPDYERATRSLSERARRIDSEARLRGYQVGRPNVWVRDLDRLAESIGLEEPFEMPDDEQLRRERFVDAQVAPLRVAPPLGATTLREVAWITDFIPIMSTLNDIYRAVVGVDPTTMEEVSTGGRVFAGGFALLDILGLTGALLRAGPVGAARMARVGLSQPALQRTHTMLEALRSEAPAVDAAVHRAQTGQRLTAREVALVNRAEEATREMRQTVRPTSSAPTGPTHIEGMREIPNHLRAIDPSVARRAMSGGRASAGRSGGFGRIVDDAIDAVREAAGRAGVPFARARRALSSAHDDVIGFINRFHTVPGFASVLADYLRGDRFRQGARYVMQFVEANVRQPVALVAEGRIAFEVPRGGLRRMDVVISNVRYEFKSVIEFRSYSSHARQLRRDLADLLAQMPDSPEHLRWVFDANRLGMDRTELVNRMQETVRRSFGDHPRAADLEFWLETIVIVW